MHLAEGSRTDPAFSSQTNDVVTARFGPGNRRLAVAGAVTEHEHTWTLKSEDISDALDLMETLEPFPEHWRGAPLCLAVGATFCLCDPATGQAFPGQDPELYGHQDAGGGRLLGQSSIYLRLSTTSTCALFLSLSFPEVTPTLSSYIERLGSRLPFDLSRKHWSRWQLNAEGTRYYNRKISVTS
ncbi:MAG TPA: hypothetical protein VFK76_07425 [Gaiellaceae bacterium]|nr:hypothetical protein [Gaiellaceae bacterium]